MSRRARSPPSPVLGFDASRSLTSAPIAASSRPATLCTSPSILCTRDSISARNWSGSGSDVDLELIDSRTLDANIRELMYTGPASVVRPCPTTVTQPSPHGDIENGTVVQGPERDREHHHAHPGGGRKGRASSLRARAGSLTAVPNGSVIMSPGNRRNPYRSTALGLFGWDVLPGFYKVTAQHPGCTAAHGGRTARTRVLTVPPAVIDLRLVLRCPHLRRDKTRTTLRVHKVPVDEVVLRAVVQGHHPQGLVVFTLGGRKLGTVPVDPRDRHSALTITGKRIKGIRARYEGDGDNAPSVGGG